MRRFFQKHLNPLVAPSARDLGALRILAVAGALVIVAFHIANRVGTPGSYDPLAVRMVLAASLLVALALSYTVASFRRHFATFLLLVGLLYCLWMVVLTYRNEFGREWMLSTLVLVIGCLLTFPRVRHQLAFSVTVVTFLTAAYAVAEPQAVNQALAAARLLFFAAFVIFSSWLRDRQINRLERLSMVARQTHAAVLLLDPSGRPEWSNGEARELMGHWAEALEDKKGTGPLGEEEAERLRVFRGRLALAQPFRQEVRLTNKEGQGRWVDLDVTPITRPGSKQVTGHVVVGRDVTDQKEAEKELRRSEGRYRRLVERSPMPIIALQGERILYANRAAARLLRVAAPSLLSGRNLLTQVSKEDRRETQRWLERVRLEEGGSSRELALDRLDGGGQVEVLVQASSVVFAGQEVLQLVLSDLTERKQVERAKDDFVSTVNHELRTPLTSLRGSLGLLDAGLFEQGGEKARMLVDLALRNTERLTLLINDLLDMQKIEAGKADFRMEIVDLTEQVRAAVESNQLFADRFDITFRLVREAPGGLVYADPNRLSQVLSNLLSNAAKFSPNGSSVDVFVDRAEGGFRVTVVDQGPGIPASFRDQLFRKFSRSEPARANQIPGTGLGLAISRAIIEQHGGLIDLDHDYQDGAAFYFVLPETDLLPRTSSGVSVTSA
jgi:PAS domain S-box-containing protein